MRRIYPILMFIPALLLLASCNIRDEYDDCGVYLKFVFDYNMEYSDSFDPQVETIDVYIFDGDGRYLFTRSAECSELHNRNMMLLSDGLAFGSYQILTVGGACEHFAFTDLDGKDFVPGVTTIEQAKLALAREIGEVSHEFPHLWFGQTVAINYKADLTVWPIHLIRQTNRFHITLENVDEKTGMDTPTVSPYTFEIVTPEGAVYDYNNNPLVRETVVYRPYSLAQGIESNSLSRAKINTMRLFGSDEDGYRIIVRTNSVTRDGVSEVWNYDLMALLNGVKPDTRPDGTTLPLQEFLDRQGEWNIVILHRGGTAESNEGFLALGVRINDWIVWFNDIGV